MAEWYEVRGIDKIASPGLLIYKDRVIENIARLIARVQDVSCLRPHVKTNKMAEVCQLMQQQGITKFKCATLPEAEMLGMVQAPDVLLAYQPVGPNIDRFMKLTSCYTATQYSCLVDNLATLEEIAKAAETKKITAHIYIDLNVGMNRTGTPPENAMALVEQCLQLTSVKLVGLHGYDGHVNDTDVAVRQLKSDEGYDRVKQLQTKVALQYGLQLPVVAGGSPSFVTHAHRHGVECSPGTFVFWDWGYKHRLPLEPYKFAALVVCRVISVINGNTICTDLGHKSIAAENPQPRVHFLNAPDAKPISQSEEHLVLQVPDAGVYPVGKVLYGVPEHICPTVALYDEAVVIENAEVVDTWTIIARRKKINL